MSREFKIERTVELPATPDQVWDAIATANGAAGWLFPFGDEDVEPRVGGAALGGHVVEAYDRPHHLRVRLERPDGWFNALEHRIEANEGGTVTLRYVHSGVFEDDWDTQYDGAGTHTDFYLHTLGEYLAHFAGRTVTYVSADGPEASMGEGALAAAIRALGIADDAQVGDPVTVDVPGVAAFDAVVDYRTGDFLGLRSGDALYRIYARGRWGGPVSVAHHLFAPAADGPAATAAWSDWLTGVYAGARA